MKNIQSNKKSLAMSSVLLKLLWGHIYPILGFEVDQMNKTFGYEKNDRGNTSKV